MPRKKILWICSWYPDKLAPFNGDFIQRHAAAAMLYNDIYVIHVVGDTSGKISRKKQEFNIEAGVTEQIIYYPATNSLLGRLISHYSWLQLYRHAIRKYISEYGKPDLVHIHIPYKAGLLGGWIKKIYNIPYIITEHWTIYQPQNLVKYEQQKPLYKSIIKRAIKGCNLFLPVSNDLGLLINKLVTEKKYSVVENVANEEYFYFTDNFKKEAPFRFIHVSTMTYQKNAEAILECFCRFLEKFPATELIIVGPIPVSMLQLIEKTGLVDKNIFLKGEISYVAVAEEMQKAHALVMFSRYENSPCSIIEALCCGLPVIATNVGGIPALLDENNGLLIEALDKEALASALEAMVTNYSMYDRKKIAEHAKSRFSYTVIGKKLDEVYASVISNRD